MAALIEAATTLVSMLINLSMAVQLTQVEGECNGSWENQGSHKLNKDNELHAETKGTAQVSDKYKLHQIVNSTVDPSSALGEQNTKGVRNNGLANGLWHKDLLPLGECLEHECRQVSILSKEKQVLLVQCVDNILRIVLDNVWVCQDGDPVILTSLWCFDSIHAETTW